MTNVTVVVPAHDESSLLPAMLGRLKDVSDIRVIVVANGCRDDTAAQARNAGTAVIEVPEASKIRALNAGIDAVESYPVAFVDADVVVTGSSLTQLADRLDGDPGVHVASPRMRVAPSTSWIVRQYYRVWALTDYRSAGHIGSGVYMLDAEGFARLGRFPDIVADDLYVQRLFPPAERLTPDDLFFEVRAPGTLRALIRRNTRIAAGNRQLAERYPHLAAPGASAGAASLAKRVWRRPTLWAGFAVYTAVYLTVQLRARRTLARRGQIGWNRDETTREAAT